MDTRILVWPSAMLHVWGSASPALWRHIRVVGTQNGELGAEN